MILVATALAASPEEQAQLAELDRLRASIADEIQLSAYDLVDEMVVGWREEPVFDKPTAVEIGRAHV